MENIIYLCNNYGSFKDGIGAYSKKFHLEFNKSNQYHLECFTGYTDDLKKYKLFFSNRMSQATKNAIKWSKKSNESHMILIEYPFVEYNPFVLGKLKKLKRVNKGRQVILSLHEYSRVKKLRKLFINKLLKICDIIFVTSEFEKKNILEKFPNKKIFIRSIPSNIDENVDEIKDNNSFSFFGLVNSSKAFEPMINGWKKFNELTGQYVLNVITSTNIDALDFEKYNIVLHKSASDAKIASLLAKSRFCVLPIKPIISENNATLKTACLYENVCIGKFDDKISDKIGTIIMEDYSEADFKDAFFQCIKMSKDDLEKKSQISYNFGKKYSFKSTVNSYITIIEKELCNNEKN